MASSPDSKHQAGHEGAGHTQEADVLEEALAVGCAKLLERLESGERGGVQMQNWAQRSNVWVNAGVNLKYMCASAFICRLERELKSQEEKLYRYRNTSLSYKKLRRAMDELGLIINALKTRPEEFRKLFKPGSEVVMEGHDQTEGGSGGRTSSTTQTTSEHAPGRPALNSVSRGEKAVQACVLVSSEARAVTKLREQIKRIIDDFNERHLHLQRLRIQTVNRYEKKLKEMGAKHETEKEQAEVEYKSKLSSYEQRVDDLRERMEKQYAVDRRDLQQEAHKQASRELEKKVLEVQAEHDRKLQEAIQRAKLRHKETIEQLKKRHRAQQELEEFQHKVAQAKEDSSGKKRRRMEGEESGSERRASGSSMDTAEAIAELKEAHLQELQKTRVGAIHRHQDEMKLVQHRYQQALDKQRAEWEERLTAAQERAAAAEQSRERLATDWEETIVRARKEAETATETRVVAELSAEWQRRLEEQTQEARQLLQSKQEEWRRRLTASAEREQASQARSRETDMALQRCREDRQAAAEAGDERAATERIEALMHELKEEQRQRRTAEQLLRHKDEERRIEVAAMADECKDKLNKQAAEGRQVTQKLKEDYARKISSLTSECQRQLMEQQVASQRPAHAEIERLRIRYEESTADAKQRLKKVISESEEENYEATIKRQALEAEVAKLRCQIDGVKGVYDRMLATHLAAQKAQQAAETDERITSIKANYRRRMEETLRSLEGQDQGNT